MAARKPLPANCNGSIDCPAAEHVEFARNGMGFRFTHIKLTEGQRKTLRERRALARSTTETNAAPAAEKS